MSILYKEKNRFLIRHISNNAITAYLDPILSILIKLINVQNNTFIQYIGETSLLTNDVKKIVELLDIRVGFFKQYIQNTLVNSSFEYYNTFEAFLLCRMIRDFSLLGNDFSVQEKLEFIKDGEEILYKQIKQLRINYCNQELIQLVNYHELIGDIYQSYIKPNINLFLKDSYNISFVNIKSSFYDFKAYNDSYALEISERNLMLNQFIQNKDDILIKEIILCDYSCSYLEFKNKQYLNKNKKYLIITTSVLDQQEIDSFYSLLNILIICNIQLKSVRELSFLFSLQVYQSASDSQNHLEQSNGFGNDNNQFKLKILYRQNIEYNRKESELFHLKSRIPLLITSIQNQNNIQKQMISTVISVPSSLIHKQQSISQQIIKQFKKLKNILTTKKLALGKGEFENNINQMLKQFTLKNPYLIMLCQVLSDYNQYLQRFETNTLLQQTENQIFYDDYRQKKRIFKKVNQTLKLHIMTQIEMQYEVQKKK